MFSGSKCSNDAVLPGSGMAAYMATGSFMEFMSMEYCRGERTPLDLSPSTTLPSEP